MDIHENCELYVKFSEAVYGEQSEKDHSNIIVLIKEA